MRGEGKEKGGKVREGNRDGEERRGRGQGKGGGGKEREGERGKAIAMGKSDKIQT